MTPPPDTGGWRSYSQLKRGVKRLLRDLQIGSPLDVSLLCQRLAQHRGRSIRLVPWPLVTPGAFGLWIATSTTDYILYQQETTPAHQDHIILHEVGHIISGHDSNEHDSDLSTQLNSDVVWRALRRESYTSRAEWEAEMVATVVTDWSALLTELGITTDERTDSGARVSGAFGDHQAWL